jgi:GGDEF domain-containing protein
MQPGPPRRRHARPVGVAEVETLLSGCEELTKGWLVALLEDAPLVEAPAIVSAVVVTEGPRLCAAVVRALADDGELARLSPGGSLEPLVRRVGLACGARDAPGALRLVDALQAVVWSALREGLHGADGEHVAVVAERLALVGERVRLTVAEGWSAGAPGSLAGEAPGFLAGEAPGFLAGEAPGFLAGEAPGSWAGEAPGIEALDEQIAAARGAGAPLSLLLVELEDAERVAAVEPVAVAAAAFGAFSDAVRGALGGGEVFVRGGERRAWVIAPRTARAGAVALGERIASAVALAGRWRGGALSASVGVAVLGEDGGDRRSLVDAAEASRFAAAAAGVAVVRDGGGDRGGEPAD